MSTKTVFLPYWIYIADKAEAVRLGASTDPGANQAVGTIARAPDDAATEFNAPKFNTTELWPVGQNCIVSDWIGPNPTWQNMYPTNVASFERKSGGWFGISWLFGTTTKYYWRGAFRWNPKIDAPSVPGETKVPMARLRWIDGFEAPHNGSGGTSNNLYVSPGASRHAGGFGMPIRNSTQAYKQHNCNEPAGGANPVNQWDRFYIRIRKAPEFGALLWRIANATYSNVGIGLWLAPDLRITVNWYDNSAATGPLGSITGDALELETWYKVDVLISSISGGASGFVKVFINGTLRFSMTAGQMASGIGVNVDGLWATCTLGNAAAGHHGSWDFDDWRGAALPSATYAGLDWLHGSKIVRVPIKAFATSNDGNFAPAGGYSATCWKVTTARPLSLAASNTGGVGMSTSVAGALLALVVDTQRVFSHVGAMGMTGFTVSLFSLRAGSTNDGKLSYKLPGGTQVDKTITEQTTPVWNSASYFPQDDRVDPVQLAEGLEVYYTGNSAATNKTCYALSVSMELLGDFYPEDRTPQVGDPADLSGILGQTAHFEGWINNAPYPESPWTKLGPAPPAPLSVKGGTFTGNGIVTELAFRAPVQFFFVRKTGTIANDTLVWCASATSSQSWTGADTLPFIEAFQDPNYTPATEDDYTRQYIVRIVGNSAACNANGTTYQYIAIMDPGMRFFEAGQLKEFAYGDAVTLMNGLWSPEMAFFLVNYTNSSDKSFLVLPFQWTSGYVMSPGAAAWGGAASVGDKAINTPAGSGLYQSAGQRAGVAYFASRRDDGSGDEGVAKVINMTTWTGDGNATRTVNFAPSSGRRPMFAIVAGSSGTVGCQYRDPSHTGVYSTYSPGTVRTSGGITGGGIDQITVGSDLNANGVVYTAWVLWAATADEGNGGWGTNGENQPVDPTGRKTGPGTPWGPEPDLPGEPTGPVEPEPTPGTDEEYDFSDDCIDDSVKIINKALTRIGISKQIGNILTETSAEATAARLHYTDDVSATLRDFPWPFATRYAHLYACYGPAEDQDLVQAWYSTRRYELGECVRVSDENYYCLVAHTNRNPTLPANAAYWTSSAPEEANGDWLYGYRVPDRFVFARRIVDPLKTRRAWDPDPPPFRLGSDETGLVIYSNQLSAELEYTIRLQCAAAVGDPLFRSALAWRHAHAIAPALARDEKKVAYCWSMYDAVLNQAKRWAAAEQQQEKEGDADWITARQ